MIFSRKYNRFVFGASAVFEDNDSNPNADEVIQFVLGVAIFIPRVLPGRLGGQFEVSNCKVLIPPFHPKVRVHPLHPVNIFGSGSVGQAVKMIPLIFKADPKPPL